MRLASIKSFPSLTPLLSFGLKLKIFKLMPVWSIQHFKVALTVLVKFQLHQKYQWVLSDSTTETGLWSSAPSFGGWCLSDVWESVSFGWQKDVVPPPHTHTHLTPLVILPPTVRCDHADSLVLWTHFGYYWRSVWLSPSPLAGCWAVCRLWEMLVVHFSSRSDTSLLTSHSCSRVSLSLKSLEGSPFHSCTHTGTQSINWTKYCNWTCSVKRGLSCR